MTRACGRTSAIRRVASTPSQRGMRRSIRITSGARAAVSATASSPSAAVPTTSMPGSRPSSIASPSRTTRWSSASSTRIGSSSAHAGRNSSTRKPSRRRRGGEPAAEQLGALAHAGQPVAEARLVPAVRRPAAAVLDGEPGAVVGVAQPHVDALGVGVAADVRERLLRGPVDGEPRLGAAARAARRRARARSPRRSARGTPSVSAREPVGPRHVAAAQRLDRAPRLLQPAAGEVVAALDGLDDARVGAGAAREQPRALELDGERGERVREHVVHLAREVLALAQRDRAGAAPRGSPPARRRAPRRAPAPCGTGATCSP